MIKTIIIEDEPIARKILREYCMEIPYIYLIDEFEHPLKALQKSNFNEVQLLLMDIEMPKLNGLDFIKTMQSPPLIILTTAYPQYALDGFELNVCDYLVKPIAFDRFLKACNKALEYLQLVSKKELKASDPRSFFFVKCQGRLEKINCDEIFYIESLQNYIIIHTRERKYIVHQTLKAILEELPENQFIKIHKSFIVALDKITTIEQDEICMQEIRIPLSRRFRAEFLEKALQQSWGKE